MSAAEKGGDPSSAPIETLAEKQQIIDDSFSSIQRELTKLRVRRVEFEGQLGANTSDGRPEDPGTHALSCGD